jgi:hypothetical protein
MEGRRVHWRRGLFAGILILVIVGGTTAARSATPVLTFLEAAGFAVLLSIPLVVVALRLRRLPARPPDGGPEHAPRDR